MKKKTKIKLIVIFFILLMILLICIKIKTVTDDTYSKNKKLSSMLEDIEINTSAYANITKYIVYGTHFNLEGTIDIPEISDISISDVSVIIKSLDNEDTTINSEYSYDSGILEFSTIDEINDGLNLENLQITSYYVFVKVIFTNNEVYYYSVQNATDYENITYYSITKNNNNNQINIEFNTYNNFDLMEISVVSIEELPENVYDIVIDPAHGGTDSGAESEDGNYTEADLMLDLALNLKATLEDLGYKVQITRDESLSSSTDTTDVYADDGRVTIANESHAKLLISLHMDSNYYDLSTGGVEVYAPNDCDLSFAQSLADNLVSKAGITYSSLNIYKKSNGVYVHNFNDSEIELANNSAKNNGYDPYDITTSTPYLYMIRETGGISTNAYVDGRNTAYSANKYYNSNIGIESYVINIGYIDIKADLNNLLENQSLYSEAICDSIQNLY